MCRILLCPLFSLKCTPLNARSLTCRIAQVIYGPRYKCKACDNYNLCFKCYRYIEIDHYKEHTWKSLGVPIDNEDEIRPKELSRSDTDSSGWETE